MSLVSPGPGQRVARVGRRAHTGITRSKSEYTQYSHANTVQTSTGRHLETVRLPIDSSPWPTAGVGSSDPRLPTRRLHTRRAISFFQKFDPVTIVTSRFSWHVRSCVASGVHRCPNSARSTKPDKNPSRTTTRLLPPWLPPGRTPLEGCPSTPLRVRLLSLTFEYGFRMTSRDGSSPNCSPQAAQQLHLQCTAASCTQLQPW